MTRDDDAGEDPAADPVALLVGLLKQLSDDAGRPSHALVGQKADLTRQYICEIFKGKKVPSADKTERIVRALRALRITGGRKPADYDEETKFYVSQAQRHREQARDRRWTAIRPARAVRQGTPDRIDAASRGVELATQPGVGFADGIAVNTQIVAVGALTPPQQVACPAGVVQLRSGRGGGLFVGREAELAAIDRSLTATGVGVVTQAITGLGGVGKSTLVEQYAWGHRETFNPVWWITAEDQTRIDAGLAGLGARLNPFLAVMPTPIAAAWTTNWLATHEGWLVVLDNATEPDVIAGVVHRLPLGRFLITSRLSVGWHGVAEPLRLDVLTVEQAVELLTRITAGTVRDMADAEALCAELGCLPLAVEQAGAYLAQTGMSPAEYLERLIEYPAAMYRQITECGDTSRTIARIWHATLDRLADTTLCGQILRVLAFCAPEAVPRSLLDGLGTPPDVEHAIGRLAAYSLVTADRRMLAIHRLVQAVFRTPDPEDPHRSPEAITDARACVTERLATALPADPKEPAALPVWQEMWPHIEALTSHTTADDDTAVTARLLTRTGRFLENHGSFDRAIAVHQRALAAWERTAGTGDPETLTARNDLAYAYESAGDLKHAIPLYRQTLDERERALGTDHPHTLTSRNNLAHAYKSARELPQSIDLYRQTFTAREQALGTDHPDTLTSHSNLAGAYLAAGHLNDAILLYQQILDDTERVLGTDHPDTLDSRNNLAYARKAAGDVQLAIELYEQTLNTRTRVFGTDHPDTLASCNNLANALERRGELKRAIELYEKTVTGRARVLGTDHPDTLISRNNLAHAYKSAGEFQQAILLYEATLADRERVLGADHPATLTSRTNLAGAYRAAGDQERAITLYQQALADYERVLGTDHPKTRALRKVLASAS